MENFNNYIFLRYPTRKKWFLQIIPAGYDVPENAEIIDIMPIWDELMKAETSIKEICEKHRISYLFVNKIFSIAFTKISQNN